MPACQDEKVMTSHLLEVGAMILGHGLERWGVFDYALSIYITQLDRCDRCDQCDANGQKSLKESKRENENGKFPRLEGFSVWCELVRNLKLTKNLELDIDTFLKMKNDDKQLSQGTFKYFDFGQNDTLNHSRSCDQLNNFESSLDISPLSLFSVALLIPSRSHQYWSVLSCCGFLPLLKLDLFRLCMECTDSVSLHKFPPTIKDKILNILIPVIISGAKVFESDGSRFADNMAFSTYGKPSESFRCFHRVAMRFSPIFFDQINCYPRLLSREWILLGSGDEGLLPFLGVWPYYPKNLMNWCVDPRNKENLEYENVPNEQMKENVNLKAHRKIELFITCLIQRSTAELAMIVSLRKEKDGVWKNSDEFVEFYQDYPDLFVPHLDIFMSLLFHWRPKSNNPQMNNNNNIDPKIIANTKEFLNRYAFKSVS